MKAHLRIEQAVHGATLRLEIDAEKAGEEQIGLTRFDGDAGRNAPAVEVPRARAYVVLGQHASVRHRQRIAFDREYAVHQHQRFVRQAHPRRELIGCRVLRPQHATDQAAAEFQAGGSIQRARNAVCTLQCREILRGGHAYSGLRHGSQFDDRHARARGCVEQTDLRRHRLRQRLGQTLRKSQVRLVRRHRRALGFGRPLQHGIVESVRGQGVRHAARCRCAAATGCVFRQSRAVRAAIAALGWARRQCRHRDARAGDGYGDTLSLRLRGDIGARFDRITAAIQQVQVERHVLGVELAYGAQEMCQRCGAGNGERTREVRPAVEDFPYHAAA